MNDFLVLLRPTRDTFPGDATEAERLAVEEHFRYLNRLRDDEHVLFAGRTQDEPPLGIVLMRTADAEEAQRLAEADPAVEAGVFRFEVRPYQVAIWPFSEQT